MRRAKPYDPEARKGWARGLVHFHTRFSDGWATVPRAAQIAAFHHYDFLIVTDHLRQMTTERRHTLKGYVTTCEHVSREIGLPVIAGGEVEVDWMLPDDASQAHTLVLSVRDFMDWSPPAPCPLAPWISANNTGTVAQLQALLSQRQLPSLAAHQFQHCLLRQDADFRYTIGDLGRSSFLDFFYSSAVDLLHEPEDISLVNGYATAQSPKGVYAGCDYHVGPESWPLAADFALEARTMRKRWRKVFRSLSSLWLRFKGQAETAACVQFAEEQLSHATYVYLGREECEEKSILDAFRDGRTCATRGETQFAEFKPIPSFTKRYPAGTEVRLHLPESYSQPRPRSVIVFRDGRAIHWQPVAMDNPDVVFAWQDPSPLPGLHVYQVAVPSKFVSSPILMGA